MAYNPYFTFADPALQQAVVQEAQIQAAARAAQAQQRAATLAAIRQERQAALERQERQAIREGDIRRLDANEAERRRQFDANQVLQREAIASNEKVSGVRTKDFDDRELFNNLLKLVESDDPPTVKELEARMIDLSDVRKQTLRDRRNATAAAKKLQFAQSVNEANRLKGLIGKSVNGKTLTADDVLRGSQWRNVLQITPDGLGFESLLRPPREDGVAVRMPGTEDIGSVFARLPGAIAQSAQDIVAPMIERADTFGGRVGAALRGLGGLFSVDRLDPVPPNAPFTRAPAFVPSAAASGMAGTLGNRGVLAPLDYTGPEFDYSSRFRVPPSPAIDPELEGLLRPPVFVPPY